MSKTRRTKVEIETHELTRVRFGPGTISTQCQNCGETVSLSADVVAYGMDVAPAEDGDPSDAPALGARGESTHRRLLRGLISATKKRKR